MKGIGIDFGTTHSVLAYWDGKRAVPLLDEQELPHPSVVWYRAGEPVVGRRAKESYHAYVGRPGHTFVTSVKRIMGRDREVDTGVGLVPAWQVASHILSHLRRQAEGIVGTVSECVITVPILFDGRYRADLRRAAGAAGLSVQTFVHEPFAALVGYLAKAGQLEQTLEGWRHLVVFDWGGGTLDITVVTVEDGRLFERATAALADRGGDDFDRYLRDHLQSRFWQRHRIPADAPPPTRQSQGRLLLEAERRKIELSVRERTTASVADYYAANGRALFLEEPVDRATFQALIQRDLEAAVGQVRQALDAAGLEPPHVHQVLLVGGSSRIPAVVDALRDVFGPSRVLPVQEAATLIAEGAALVAQREWRPYLVYPISVLLADGNLYRVFEAGMPLGTSGTLPREVRFYCTDQRDGAAHLILVEERPGGKRRILCVLPIPVDPRIRQYQVERVHVRFAFDQDLILHVEAYGSARGETVTAQVHDICFGLRTR